jgi:DUF3073 family protein
MGRGRAKAKQTKVARDLKYRTHETDLSALARELHGGPGDPLSRVAPDDAVEDDSEVDTEVDATDEWSDYADDRT